MVALPSLTRITMLACTPLLLGVPVRRPVAVLKVAQLGLLVIVKPRVSPSASVATGVNEYAAPAPIDARGVPVMAGTRFTGLAGGALGVEDGVTGVGAGATTGGVSGSMAGVDGVMGTDVSGNDVVAVLGPADDVDAATAAVAGSSSPPQPAKAALKTSNSIGSFSDR